MTYGYDLSKEHIDELAAAYETTAEFILALYREVYGDEIWDQIVEIDVDNYPQVGHETWQYICQICIDKSNAELVGYSNKGAGGLFWMNKGFSADEHLSEWYVWLRPVTLSDGSQYPTKQMMQADADPRASMNFPGGEA